MEERRASVIRMEGAKLIFRNFRGVGGDYNQEGQRNFSVLLDDENAERLIADGWNVKYLKPRPDDPEQHSQPYLSVKVNYRKRISKDGIEEVMGPTVVLINSLGKRNLHEENVGQLDWSRIVNADVVIAPSYYPAMGGRKGGISAYLRSLYVTIEDDPFEVKYAHIRDLDAISEGSFVEDEEN